MSKPAKSAKPCGPSRGSELLEDWRGNIEQQQACVLLDLDPASYSRFEKGIRKPPSEILVRIEQVTKGFVPAVAWFQPPLRKKRAIRAAS